MSIDTKAKIDRLTSELLRILIAIPGVDQDTAKQAFGALLGAANNYLDAQYIVDTDGWRHKPKITEERANNQNFLDSLGVALQHLDRLHPQARSLLNSFNYGIKLPDSPWTSFRGRLLQLIELAEFTKKELKSQPNKVADVDRMHLALDVALVFRNILKKKPASTRDRGIHVIPSPKRASYACVLRKTLEVAGCENVDIGPLIDGGLELLRDPELPHNL